MPFYLQKTLIKIILNYLDRSTNHSRILTFNEGNDLCLPEDITTFLGYFVSIYNRMLGIVYLKTRLHQLSLVPLILYITCLVLNWPNRLFCWIDDRIIMAIVLLDKHRAFFSLSKYVYNLRGTMQSDMRAFKQQSIIQHFRVFVYNAF